MQQIRNLVTEEFSAVNHLIIDKLHSEVGLVENIGQHLINAGGKRLRPLLVLLTAAACGYQGDKHIRLAVVIEFLHTATLLHDDVVDVSDLRRGLPTANAKWGNAPSVLVGDFIYSRAFQIMVSMGDIRIMELLSDTTNRIAEGEVLQLMKSGDASTTEAQYLEVIKNKTAVLFAAATQGAGILAKTSEETASALYNYGLHLGMAFQLIDDVLDYTGNPEETGKNIGDDLSEGKPTLPLIQAIKKGTTAQAQLVKSAIINKDVSKLDDIIAAVTESGALLYTKEQALKHSQSACQSLAVLPESDYKNALVQLSKMAVERVN
jgi:octaprenyl-diphosphate synthase